MDNRKYNIYFSTHTVSGIIICAVLYVMFFAGSFSFFKDDLAAWQKNESYLSHKEGIKQDFNYLLDSLGRHHALKGRDVDFSLQRHQSGVYVSMSASHDPVIKKLKPKKKPEKNAAEAVAAMRIRSSLPMISETARKRSMPPAIRSVNSCTGYTF